MTSFLESLSSHIMANYYIQEIAHQMQEESSQRLHTGVNASLCLKQASYADATVLVDIQYLSVKRTHSTRDRLGTNPIFHDTLTLYTTMFNTYRAEWVRHWRIMTSGWSMQFKYLQWCHPRSRIFSQCRLTLYQSQRVNISCHQQSPSHVVYEHVPAT